ncbi:MAG: ATP-grasp domain-containing protein [Clostridia bacterium]|nr:ATP-grasp domain-containing protein [Clostridia bacterium]
MIALVTDVHYRMTPAMVRVLGRQGIPVYTCEKETERILPGARSKYRKKHFSLPAEGYEDALYDLLEQLDKPVLLPMGAATLQLVSAQKERFEKVAHLCIAEPAALELLNSKRKLHQLAPELEIPVPKETDQCPCVVKPVCGEKFGLHAAERYTVCGTPAQRDEAIAHFTRLTGEPPVVQEYLPGEGIGCSVIAREGRVIAWIGHRRIREYPVTGGPSSCCIAEDHGLLPWVEKIVAATHFSGPAMFEFKRDAEGNPRLLECNPRIWGSFPLAEAAESTLPYAWFAASCGLEIPENYFKKGQKMCFFPSDFAAGMGYFKQKNGQKFVAALADLMNPAVKDGLFRLSDPAPALAYYAGLLQRGGRS